MRHAVGVTLILAGVFLVVIGVAGAITWGDEDTAAYAPIIVGGAVAVLGLFVAAVGWLVRHDSRRVG